MEIMLALAIGGASLVVCFVVILLVLILQTLMEILDELKKSNSKRDQTEV